MGYSVRAVPVEKIRKSLEDADLSPKSTDPNSKRFNIYYTSEYKEEVQRCMEDKNIKSENQFWIEAGIAFLLGNEVSKLQASKEKLIEDIGDLTARAKEIEERESKAAQFEDRLIKEKEEVKAREKDLAEREVSLEEKIARLEKELENKYKDKERELEEKYQQKLDELASKKEAMESELREARAEIVRYIELEYSERDKALKDKENELYIKENILNEKEKFWDVMYAKVMQLIKCQNDQVVK